MSTSRHAAGPASQAGEAGRILQGPVDCSCKRPPGAYLAPSQRLAEVAPGPRAVAATMAQIAPGLSPAPCSMTVVPRTLMVQVPPDWTPGPGQTIQVTSPLGTVVQAAVPTGCAPGSTFQTHNPDADAQAGVITTQPAAIQASVHAKIRDGHWEPITYTEALAYSRTLTQSQYSAKNPSLRGCHRCRPARPGKCGFTGCICVYLFACSDDCVYSPCCCMGLIWPLFSCIRCWCERSPDGTLIERDGTKKKNEIIVVDHERGTIAIYGGNYGHEDEHPACYCEKI